ncbi:MAG: hypothetical protein IT339_05695 [Thermomicrobiales bacterium]|nr:hypothetical protein [Thermomicrobiales bacterium]
MADGVNDAKVVPFPGQGGIDLGPGTAYEAITRTRVDELAADVKEIRARIDGIFWLIAGSIVVDVVLRAIGAGG